MQPVGKVVLVTGAQQGIGRAMALEFAAAGADVAINWLDDDSAAQSNADEVRAQGRRALLVQADMGRLEQVQAMASAVAGPSAASCTAAGTIVGQRQTAPASHAMTLPAGRK
jgi:NAD(P)-dependent dehydrogenase (short-subunit alcohol dehydrogenase family)